MKTGHLGQNFLLILKYFLWVNRYQFPPLNPLWHKCLGVVMVALGLTGWIGNGVVVYIFLLTPALRTPSNLLVINLAFSDFLMMMIQCPPMVISCYFETWVLGKLKSIFPQEKVLWEITNWHWYNEQCYFCEYMGNWQNHRGQWLTQFLMCNARPCLKWDTFVDVWLNATLRPCSLDWSVRVATRVNECISLLTLRGDIVCDEMQRNRRLATLHTSFFSLLFSLASSIVNIFEIFVNS